MSSTRFFEMPPVTRDDVADVIDILRPALAWGLPATYFTWFLTDLAVEVIETARRAASKQEAELRLQELLLREHCRIPLSTAARFIDGPFAHLFPPEQEK
jgi:hypothetical protein